jgi:hypothetical protein
VTRAIAPAVGPALALALALATLTGCPDNQLGTIAVGLTTAPGSTLMDRVVQLRLTFTNPRQVLVVDRTERGFDLALELNAGGEVGALVVDGLDAGGALVATGMSPPFPLAAIDARVVVYMAPPMSVGPAPAALAPARSGSSAAALTYGAILAGGVEPGGPAGAIQIYNAYDHSLTTGLPMPGRRAGVTIAVGASNSVYLFGGTDPGGAPTGTLWFFDTTAAPSGRYAELGDFPQFARTGAAAVPVGGDGSLITGAPPIQLLASQIDEPANLAAISSGASVIGSDQAVTTVVVDDATGDLLRLRAGAIQPIGVQRKHGLAVALPDRRIAVLGGDATPRDALLVDPAAGDLTPVPGVLAELYATLAVAVTPRFLVVAGGRTGGASTAIEILDAATLERRHLASVDDAITAAIALPNGQALLIGATLQLFTPPPPE